MIRIRSVFLLAVLILFPLAGFAKPTEEDRAAVDHRASELVPFLPEQLVPSLPPISDRDFWDEKAALPSGLKVIHNAEKLLKSEIQEMPEELYKEFYRNGNRSHYQNVYDKVRDRLNVLGTAELLENKGRFLPAYEETARFLCAYPSWSLPAHDHNAAIYDGKIESVDLVSSYLSERLALYTRGLAEVLPPDLVEEIEKNIRVRTLNPIKDYIENDTKNDMLWWVTTTNNWNPVCFCGTVCAVLNTCESREERAWFLAAAEYFVTKYYFRGFTEDGCCTEGLSYWNYGFGKFTALAEHEFRATGGEINLYRIPLVRPVTEYVLKTEAAPNCYAAFADCHLGVRPSAHVLAFLSKRLGLGYTNIEEKELVPNFGIGQDLDLFPQDDLVPVVPVSETGINEQLPNELPRSYLPNSEILICRTPQNDPAQFAAVFKGGNNGEHHNHNDLGTFCVLRNGIWLIADPGSETYTKRTFSSDRYKGELLNSYGHPVPRINEALQAVGAEADAAVIETEFTDTADRFGLDLTSAYPDSGANRITRSFLYERKPAGTPNKLTITDRILFQPGTAETVDIPFVTYEKWEQLDDQSFRIYHTNKEAADPGIRVKVTAQTADGTPVSGTVSVTEIGKDDPSVPDKPTRIAWEGKGDGNGTEIVIVTEICPE